MQKAFIISPFLYSHSNDKDETSSIKMPKLLNQDSYKHICFSCCPCVPPAVYVALIIERLLLGWYHPQELCMCPLSPQLWMSLTMRSSALFASMQTLTPPHLPRRTILTIHRALIFCLLLPMQLKEEADADPVSMGGAQQMQTHQMKQKILQQIRKC